MNLRNAQWKKLNPLLPGKDNDPGATARDNRLFLQAVIWVVSHQAKWSDLPPKFGKWQTSYMRFRRWNQAAIWRQIASHLHDDRDLQKILNAIVAFGDEHTRRTVRRLEIRNNKIAYHSALTDVAPLPPRPSNAGGTIQDSSSHWVWLLTRK